MSQPEILILGTGALACHFAARLAEADIPFVMLGSWTEGISFLKEYGVRTVNENGEEKKFPVKVTAQTRLCKGIPYVFVLVKSRQTVHAASQLVDCLPANGICLTLQNGLGNYEILSKALGTGRVAVGTSTAGVHLTNPGTVKLAGEGVVTLGVHARLKPLVDVLGRAGFFVEIEPDINSMQWGTLIINSAIFPLTTLLDVKNGELLSRPTARALMTAIVRESASVAVAKGINLPYPDPVVAVEAITRRTTQNYSPMLQDARRGVQTEIEPICGAIVRAGRLTNVATPINQTMLNLVKALF